jgi:hypothetical protein
MRNAITLILAFVCLAAQAQSKKEIKTNKIKSTTEYTIQLVDGKEVNWKSCYMVFDKEGNTTEKTDFMQDGSVKKKNTAKFDSKGNKIEETNYVVKEDKKPDEKPEGKNTKTVSKYNSGNDKVEEVVMDATSGKPLKKTQISYNSNGDKTTEVHFDGDNKLLKKEVYTYDKKGLKIEHKVYDGNNTLIEGKKYVYQF